MCLSSPSPSPTAGFSDFSRFLVIVEGDKAVGSGKVSAAQVAQMVFDGIRLNQFYIYSHPKALGNANTRFDAIVAGTNPPDPFAERPDIGIQLKQALRGH